MCNTAAAKIRNSIAGFLAGIASKGNYVDQRRFIEHVRNCAVIDSLRNWCMLVNRTQRQAYCQSKTLTYNCALLKDAVSITCRFSRDNRVWDLFDSGIVPILIGKTGNLGEYLSSDFFVTGVVIPLICTSSRYTSCNSLSTALKGIFYKTWYAVRRTI